MAEKQNYPQIPTTVWWGLRQLLRKSPSATIDDGFLAVNLGVQPAASRQYVTELRRVGLISEESRATTLAMRWRNDETYREAADEIIRSVYPQGLRDVAPPGEADRTKTINWFMHQGLGEGSAKNKAATYLLIANDQIQDGSETKASSGSKAIQPEKKKTAAQPVRKPDSAHAVRNPRTDGLPLNVNVQIHISADASSEQIETIFSSMRRYLYDDAIP